MKLAVLDNMPVNQIFMIENDVELEMFERLSQTDPDLLLRLIKSSVDSYKESKTEEDEDKNINPRCYATHQVKISNALMIIDSQGNQQIYHDEKWQSASIPTNMIEPYPFLYIDQFREDFECCFVSRKHYEKYEQMLSIPGVSEVHVRYIYDSLKKTQSRYQYSFNPTVHEEVRALEALFYTLHKEFVE
jgi:hypothetical protein